MSFNILDHLDKLEVIKETERTMITTKKIAAEPIQPILSRENRVKLTADVQIPHIDSLLTVAQGQTGTIVGHVNEFVRVKLDFNPESAEATEPFYVEVLPSQITLIDPNILISPELKSFIPPLSSDEREKLLHNLQVNGCREPLVVWEGHSILLDGHNRFELCTKYGIDYQIVEVRLSSFESAYSWIVSNQLGRRNLTPEAMSYLRGKLYNLEKQTDRRKNLTGGQNDPKLDNLTGGQNGHQLDEDNLIGGQNGHQLDEDNLIGGHFDHQLEAENLVGGQSDHQLKTASKIAQRYKVGERTIRRDAKFALAVDKLADAVGEDVRQSILSRDANLTKKKTLELAKKAEQEPDKVKEKFVEGRYVSSAQPNEFTGVFCTTPRKGTFQIR